MENTSEFFEIDGSILEGGGQILRMTAAFGVLLQKPIKVHHIRAGRYKPGLRAQHLNGMLLLRDICNGQFTGGEIGANMITFKPCSISAGNFTSNTGTAGSVALLLQVSLPCLLLANGTSHMTLKGGTDVEMAPPFDYLVQVLQPALEKFGVKCHLEVVKRGYFPQGEGVVKASVEPAEVLKAVEIMERGTVTRITGYSYVAGKLPIRIANQMAGHAKAIFKKHYPGVDIAIERKKELPDKAFGNGFGIIVIAETSTGCLLAGSAIGNVRRHDRAELIGDKAASMLLNNLQHGGCVDENLQDQLIIFMAMAEGRSRIRCGPITFHTETAIHVAHLMTKAKFRIIKEDSMNIIECDGHGIKL